MKKVDEQYVSVCRYCGPPMKRLGKRNWIVHRPAQ